MSQSEEQSCPISCLFNEQSGTGSPRLDGNAANGNGHAPLPRLRKIKRRELSLRGMLVKDQERRDVATRGRGFCVCVRRLYLGWFHVPAAARSGRPTPIMKSSTCRLQRKARRGTGLRRRIATRFNGAGDCSPERRNRIDSPLRNGPSFNGAGDKSPDNRDCSLN